MTVVCTGLAVSVDGLITGRDPSPRQPLGDGGMRLFEWYDDGDTESRFYPKVHLPAASAAVFDRQAERNGAIVSGRAPYDHVRDWGGNEPQPGVPLFVLTHQVPDDIPDADPLYTFVTDGIESAIEQARVVASTAGKDVARMDGRHFGRLCPRVCWTSSPCTSSRSCSVAGRRSSACCPTRSSSKWVIGRRAGSQPSDLPGTALANHPLLIRHAPTGA